MDSLEILKDLVDRAFGQAQFFCWICTLGDLFARLGVQCEEPFEEIAVEESSCETFLPSYNRSVPVVHGNRIGVPR